MDLSLLRVSLPITAAFRSHEVDLESLVGGNMDGDGVKFRGNE